MPLIEVAAGIPCPQTSTVTPEERRLLSEGAYGPRVARTIELDERQFQTLTWALSPVQAALFRDWYRVTLIYGGAWFSAPATWPTPEGLVVKVRRFLGDPQWTYRGNGHWLLAINAEVRGETLLPGTPGLSPFIDTFTGTAGLLTAHTPDVAPSGFAWQPPGFGTGLELDGSGDLVNVDGGSYASSNEAPAAWVAMALGTAWRIEMDATAGNGDSEYQPYASFYVIESLSLASIQLSLGAEVGGLAHLNVSSDSGSIYVSGFANGAHAVTADFTSTGGIIRVDGTFAGAISGDFSAFAASGMGGAYVEVSNQSDASLQRVAVYQNTTPVTGSAVSQNYSNLQYGFIYETDYPTASYYNDGSGPEFTAAGAGTEIGIDARAVLFSTPERTARGPETTVLEATPRMLEFKIGKLDAGQKAIVGVFPTGGPSADLDAYFAGSGNGWAAALDTTGNYYGYGGLVGNVGELFAGDVIGLVIESTSSNTAFYLNGTFLFEVVLANNAMFPFASFGVA